MPQWPGGRTCGSRRSSDPRHVRRPCRRGVEPSTDGDRAGVAGCRRARRPVDPVGRGHRADRDWTTTRRRCRCARRPVVGGRDLGDSQRDQVRCTGRRRAAGRPTARPIARAPGHRATDTLASRAGDIVDRRGLRRNRTDGRGPSPGLRAHARSPMRTVLRTQPCCAGVERGTGRHPRSHSGMGDGHRVHLPRPRRPDETPPIVSRRAPSWCRGRARGRRHGCPVRCRLDRPRWRRRAEADRHRPRHRAPIGGLRGHRRRRTVGDIGASVGSTQLGRRDTHARRTGRAAHRRGDPASRGGGSGAPCRVLDRGDRVRRRRWAAAGGNRPQAPADGADQSRSSCRLAGPRQRLVAG